MKVHRFVFRELFARRSFVVAVLAVTLLFGSTAAFACWEVLLTECFSRPATQWPWAGPPGSNANWRHSPMDPQLHWGIQADYYDQRICNVDQQAAWIIGDPVGQDPEFDSYPPNLDTYMTYGPINLSTAVAAQVSFYLYNRSEVGHDSVYWGAATAFQLTAQNMQVGGRHTEVMQVGQPFQLQIMDLANLRNYTTHDSVSMLGQSQVFIFWRFKADNTPNPPPPQGLIGAFVDEVVIARDNGGIDLRTGAVELFYPDCTEVNNDLVLGDTLWAHYLFSSCDGGVEEYPDFHITGYVADTTDTLIIMDTIMQFIQPNMQIDLASHQWIVDEPGDYTVRFKLDTLNEVNETIETNNYAFVTYRIEPPNDPPVFMWLSPGEDTLVANDTATVRWFVSDPAEQAYVSVFYDQDQFGCTGIYVPGGANRPEHDGEDSIQWNVAAMPQGRVIWLFAQVFDALHNTCYYTEFPIKIDHTVDAAPDPHAGIPVEFALNQNFPNPFNPTTRIDYSVPDQSPVTIKVFDIQGREVATLVNEDHAPGFYHAEFSGANLASGIYLYSLTTPSMTFTRKMVLMK